MDTFYKNDEFVSKKDFDKFQKQTSRNFKKMNIVLLEDIDVQRKRINTCFEQIDVHRWQIEALTQSHNNILGGIETIKTKLLTILLFFIKWGFVVSVFAFIMYIFREPIINYFNNAIAVSKKLDDKAWFDYFVYRPVSAFLYGIFIVAGWYLRVLYDWRRKTKK